MIKSSLFRLHLYPVLIFQTRYGGIYEKGEWASIANCESIPEGAVDSDTECLDWWLSDKASLVGVGATPDEAYLDMLFRYKRVGLLDD